MSETLLTRERFAHWVQEAISRMYDSPFLRTHPLAQLVAGSERDPVRRGQQLRQALLNAIQAMAPAHDAPVQSADWRAYRILELRYVEGLSPAEVMQQLSFGRSYYFREQSRMLDALTDVLWEQWQPQDGADESPGMTRAQLAHEETDRLSAQATWEAVDPVQVLEQLRPMMSSLAETEQATLRFNLSQHLLVLRADRVLLRQTLVNVVTHALDIANGGQVALSSFASQQTAGIKVVATPASQQTDTNDASERSGVGLDVCRRFMTAMGGTLQIQQNPQTGWEAQLIWPTTTSPTLLVVDDNQDFANLFRRYLSDGRWQVIGAADGQQARQILNELQPTVILLDVMMPREDGWELLSVLRNNPNTTAIPIIICSVLNEPRLAQTLGATAYLAKPVTQKALLDALAPWSQVGASLVPEPPLTHPPSV